MAQKKEKNVEKEQPKRLAILLRTMVNGYMLEVNNEGYMGSWFMLAWNA